MKKFLALVMTTAMVFGVSACSSAPSEKPAEENGEQQEQQDQGNAGTEGDSVLIGGLAPLTGDNAVYGKTATNGIELAFEEINAKGGILGGKQIEYKVMDEKGDDAEAVNAYNKLSSDGIVALIGDVTSKPSIAVAAVAAEENMPMITPTGTAADITQAGANVFRVCFIDPFQGKTMANFASQKLEAKTAAVVHNVSSDYSDGIATAFKEQAAELGIEIVADEAYGDTDIDFKTQLTKIAQANPDVLLIPDYYQKVALFASQAKEVGITATLIGADGWDGVSATLDPSSIGVVEDTYFCNHYSIMDESEKVQNFIKAYQEKYNEMPSAFAALGYDAAYILAEAIEKAGSTENQAIVDALAETNYDGVTGSMTFDENGDPVKSVSIIKIVNGEYTFDSVVDPE